MICDSTGQRIHIGDTVKFRGDIYTIKRFYDKGVGSCGTYCIEFFEEQHTSEIADEISVDLIERG